MGIRKKHINDFPTPYTCTAAIREGGMETKLSICSSSPERNLHARKTDWKILTMRRLRSTGWTGNVLMNSMNLQSITAD